jgi:hypothetical protein
MYNYTLYTFNDKAITALAGTSESRIRAAGIKIIKSLSARPFPGENKILIAINAVFKA